MARAILQRISEIEDTMAYRSDEAELSADLYAEESKLIEMLSILRPPTSCQRFERKPQSSEPNLFFGMNYRRRRMPTLTEIEMRRGAKILDRYHFGIYYKYL